MDLANSSPSLDNKNNDFLDNIKQVLRTNNDDYKEIYSMPQRDHKFSKMNNLTSSVFNQQSRNITDFSNLKSSNKTNLNLNSKEYLNKNIDDDQKSNLQRKTHSRRYNNRLLGFHDFEDVDRVVKRSSQTYKSTTAYTPTPLPDIEETPNEQIPNDRQEDLDNIVNPEEEVKEDEYNAETGIRMRARHEDILGRYQKGPNYPGLHTLQTRKQPDPNVLDMANAKGSRVAKMRIKNRLCSRNVMIPEGPKYDSNGIAYMGAYKRSADGASYVHTAIPHLLLPRCCNCCKKSVLGCE